MGSYSKTPKKAYHLQSGIYPTVENAVHMDLLDQLYHVYDLSGDRWRYVRIYHQSVAKGSLILMLVLGLIHSNVCYLMP